ncbi:PfkB family carbohydrate kinase [Candidatus Margulisiibacteriota bacterium]
MTITIIGTVAFDTIETPIGKHEKLLGGSASYAALAASVFSDVAIISIVGKDFPNNYLSLLKSKNINVDGIKVSQNDTFAWEGYYEKDMNQAFTKETQLNCLTELDPEVPDDFKNSKIVFLANVDPVLQQKAIKEFTSPQLIVLDTMNYWIEHKSYDLGQALKQVDVLIINDQEARQISGNNNVILAVKEIAKMGPKRIIVKKGEHGSIMFNGNDYFCVPALPVKKVVDPTGAGDSFAGGFVGYLASKKIFTEQTFRNAVVVGTLASSTTVQGFGVSTISKLNRGKIGELFSGFKEITTLPSAL